MKIVQMSDIHVGPYFHRADLLETTVQETNELEPDMVAVVGDLTAFGYRWEFEQAKEYLDRPNVVVAMGNHHARNVGFRYFEDLFGMRERAVTVPGSEGEAKVVVLDSSKPDLDEGEIGRQLYGPTTRSFAAGGTGPEDSDDPPPPTRRSRHRTRHEHPQGRR